MYILKKFMVFLIVILIAVLAFSIAFNQLRVRTFVNDAFTERANVILENTDTKTMSNFFDENFIAKDEMLVNRPYALYDVSQYYYDLEINYLSVGWIAPKKASVVLSEHVTEIKGQFAGTAEEKAGMSDTPPEWKPAKYKVTLKKADSNRWYIVEMEKVKDLK